MNRFRACALLLTSLFESLFAAAPASAVVTRWNTNSNGNYNVGTNWDNGIPDGDDNAVFARGAGVSYTVTFPGNLLVQPTAVYQSNIVLIDSNDVHFANSTQFILNAAFGETISRSDATDYSLSVYGTL